jgi:hypothetical protein
MDKKLSMEQQEEIQDGDEQGPMLILLAAFREMQQAGGVQSERATEFINQIRKCRRKNMRKRVRKRQSTIRKMLQLMTRKQTKKRQASHLHRGILMCCERAIFNARKFLAVSTARAAIGGTAGCRPVC